LAKAPRRLHETRRALKPARPRESAAKRGYDYQWQKLSDGFVQAYPYCVLCLCRGRINWGSIHYPLARQRSLVVDHIEPHRGDRHLLFDYGNLQTLCATPCHDLDKQRIEHGSGSVRRDWFQLLRAEVARCSSQEHLDAYQTAVPPSVWAELSPQTPTPPSLRGEGSKTPRTPSGPRVAEGMFFHKKQDLFPDC